jgi:hypothetical protein
LWNGFQSCRRITPDIINVIKTPFFQYFRDQEKVMGLDPVNREDVPAVISLLAKNSLTDSAV